MQADEASRAFLELPVTSVDVEAFGGRDLPVVIRVPRDQYKAGMEVGLEVRASYADEERHVKVQVLGPRKLAPAHKTEHEGGHDRGDDEMHGVKHDEMHGEDKP